MPYVKNHVIATNIYYHHVEDGYELNFDREWLALPHNRENAPPIGIDKDAPELSEESIQQGACDALHAKVSALEAKLALLEVDVSTLKKGKS